MRLDLTKGRSNLDFGKGFYATELYKKQWTEVYELLKAELNLK